METAIQTGGAECFKLFEYQSCSETPALPAWDGWAGEDAAEGAPEESAREATGETGEEGLRAEFEHRLAEETRRAFEAGRERGENEGRAAERETAAAAQQTAEQTRVRQAAELVERFAQEREKYLHAVEREVVGLALAVAARILRREAQMDPLLLTGAVRVALGQLSGSTKVWLRVPPAELDLWTENIALLPKLGAKPEVQAGEGMRLGDCEIVTEMGSVDLGIRAQLGEIERGFFDRAGRRKTEDAAETDDASSESQETHE
jgi:flagellar assembly protein FliH